MTPGQPQIFLRGGSAFTDSRHVAERFQKQHKDVLRAIENLIDMRPDLAGTSFHRSSYSTPIQGDRRFACYEMDKRGFSLLAMGFTGKEALDWKIKFFDAFTMMEAQLAAFQDEDEDLAEAAASWPQGADGRVWGVSVAKANAIARALSVANKLFGPEAGRYLYSMSGLPDLSGKTVSALAGTSQDDPRGCLRHLFRQAARPGQTIGQLVALALHDKAAAGSLKDFGLIMGPQEATDCLAIANEHTALDAIFAETQWNRDWRIALAQLPGARPSRNRIKFAGAPVNAVLLPRASLAAQQYPVRH